MSNSQSHQAKLLGELGSIGLTEIFETLGTKNRYGWLTLKNDGREIVLYFQGDLVGLVTLPEEKLSYIPEKLFYSNKISEEQYQVIVESEDPLSALEESVDSDIILSFLNTIYYDEICYLFSWKKGYFEFVDQKPGDQTSPIGKLFEAETILLDASRRLDENEEAVHLFPDTHEILLHNAPISNEKMPFDDPLGNVWNLANYRSFREIIYFSYLSEFDSSKVLATLFQENKIRFLNDEELFSYAKTLEQENNIVDAEKCYRILLKRDCYNVDACEALIHFHELENNKEILEELYEQIASNFLSSEDEHYRIQGAYYLKKYSDIKEKTPEGAEANAHLLDMVVHQGLDPQPLDYEPVSSGKTIFQYYRLQRQDKKARKVLENLLVLIPEDIAIRGELINIYLDLGHRQEALVHYDAVIEYYEKNKNNVELISVYRKVVRLAPSRKDIQHKLDKLNFKEKYKKNLLSKILIFLLVVGSAVGGGYYVHYIMQKKHGARTQVVAEIERFIQQDLVREAKQKVNDTLLLDQIDKDNLLKKIKDREEIFIRKIEQDVSRASFKQQEGSLIEAQEILDNVKNFHVDLNAEITERIRSLQVDISKKLKNFRLDMELANKFQEENKYDDAIKVMYGIWSNPDYAKHTERNQIKYPIRLKNLNKNIKIFVDNELSKVSNKTLFVSPGFSKIEFRADGYHTYSLYNAFGGRKKTFVSTSKQKAFPLKRSEAIINLRKAKLWSYKIGGIIEAAPAYGNGQLYIAARDDNLYTLKALESNATESWQPYKPNSLTSFNSSPVFWQNILYLAGNNNKIYAIQKKYIKAKFRLPKSSLISAPAVISTQNKLVFFLTENGQIYAMPFVKKTARWLPRWSKQLSSSRRIFAGIDQKNLYVSSKSGVLYSFNQKNGKKNWQSKIRRPANSIPKIYNEKIFFGGSGTFYSFDKNTGKELWSTSVKGRVAGQPAVNKRGIFFGTSAFAVYGLDHKGNIKWRVRKDDEFEHSPILNKKNVLYIACKNGTVYALNSLTGKTLWEYAIKKKAKIEQKITSPLTLKEGKLFVGSYKEIYAFLDN